MENNKNVQDLCGDLLADLNYLATAHGVTIANALKTLPTSERDRFFNLLIEKQKSIIWRLSPLKELCCDFNINSVEDITRDADLDLTYIPFPVFVSMLEQLKLYSLIIAWFNAYYSCVFNGATIISNRVIKFMRDNDYKVNRGFDPFNAPQLLEVKK